MSIAKIHPSDEDADCLLSGLNKSGTLPTLISVLVIKFEVEVKDSEHITIPLNFIKEFVVHTTNGLLKTTFPYTWFNLPFIPCLLYNLCSP